MMQHFEIKQIISESKEIMIVDNTSGVVRGVGVCTYLTVGSMYLDEVDTCLELTKSTCSRDVVTWSFLPSNRLRRVAYFRL